MVDQAAPSVRGRLRSKLGLERRQLVFAPDHRCVEPPREGRRALDDAEQAPGADGLGLALELHRLHRLDEHRIRDEPVGRVAEQDLAGAGCGLESLRGGDGSAGRERLPVGRIPGDDLAGVDPGPDREPHAVRFLQLLVQAAERGAQVDGGAYSAQRVVVVDGRDAEDGHDRVADELLDGAPVPLELPAHDGVVLLHHLPHHLGVERLAERREVRDVGEDDGDRLAGSHGQTLGG